MTEAKLATGGLMVKRARAVTYARNPATDLLDERVEDVRGIGYDQSRKVDGEELWVPGNQADELASCYDQLLETLDNTGESELLGPVRHCQISHCMLPIICCCCPSPASGRRSNRTQPCTLPNIKAASRLTLGVLIDHSVM